MCRMKRFRVALGAVLAVVLILPATAGATIESVPFDTPFANPSCPESSGVPCKAITRTIGYQAKVGTKRGLMTVAKNGRLVSWTIKLGKPSAAEIKFFEKNYGGPAQASIAVLRTGRKLRARVVAVSPPVTLTKYFGTTVELPLETTIPVEKGWVIGISVPSWAPAFAINLGGDTSWRASRKEKTCNDFSTQTAAAVNAVPQFYCLYRTEQLTYSARVIANP